VSRKRQTPDVELVRAAAATRWIEIISHLGGVGGDLLDGQHHPCPKCGGEDRFRMIDQAAGALMCNRCFSTKNGDGFAALQWLNGWDFRESLGQVAEYVGVKVEKTKADPAERLEFLEWSDAVVANWCRTKPPIEPAAVKAAGGRLAKYRKRHVVVAFPIRNQAGKDRGWVIYNASGGTLPKFSRKTKEVEWVKVKVTYGSKPGLMGNFRIDS